MPTTAPRCANTPLLSMLARICLFMEFYIFILACIACTLPARGERAPRSTNTLQGCFHRSPGLRFIVSCTLRTVSSRGSPGSIGGTETPAGQPMDVATSRSAHTPSTALPGVQEGCWEQQPWFGPVTWIFQPRTRVSHSGWGGASSQPTRSSPRGCCYQNWSHAKTNHN